MFVYWDLVVSSFLYLTKIITCVEKRFNLIPNFRLEILQGVLDKRILEFRVCYFFILIESWAKLQDKCIFNFDKPLLNGI